MNQYVVDGYVGAITRKEQAVVLRIVHKEKYFSKQRQEWDVDEDWVSINFFGRKGDAVERTVKINDHVFVIAKINQWPKEGPESRLRVNGIEFHVIDKDSKYRNVLAEAEVYEEGS